jgi:hypothetical protein
MQHSNEDAVRTGRDFAGAVRVSQDKCGREALSEEDLLVLACEAISRTYTYEEKGYA